MSHAWSPGRSRRCPTRRAWLAAAVVVAAAACGDGRSPEDLGDVASLADLGGRLSHPAEVVVVPDRFWETDDEASRWEFRGYASLLVEVRTRSLEELRFVLEPDGATSGLHFMIRWDGERLWPEPRRLAETGQIIRIPRGNLAAGRHRLTVRRVASADGPEQRARADNVFTGLGYELGAGRFRLEPAEAERLEMVRAFLEDGVVGAGRQKYGGWLAVGSRQAQLRIRLDEAVTAAFDVLSVTGTPARFAVEAAGEEQVVSAASDPKPLEVRLPAGESVVRFEVEGSADGLHLWGAPRMIPPRSSGRGGPVVLLTLDTTRLDALSFYGGPPAASPSLASLAERATVYDNAWAASPWTLPSHASIFTGQYPSRHGAGVAHPRLVEGVPTLAEAYRRAGYRTAGFAGGEMTASHWGVAQGFESFYDPEGFETRGDRLTDLAEEFVSRVAGQPFFLFVNYFDPHAAYEAPAEQQQLFAVDEHRRRLPDGSVWAQLAAGRKGVWRKIVHEGVEVPDGAVDWLRAAYHAEVAFMDQQIGRLLDRLESLGLDDDATIVLVADHGEFLGEGGFFSHCCRLEPELTHVPLIIKWPRQQRPERVAELVSHVDLAPTLLAHSGLELPAVDGVVLEPGGAARAEQRSAVFMEEHENRIHPLIERIMIARHLFGRQQDEARQIFWEGGSECFHGGTGGWTATPCEVDWQQLIQELEAMVRAEVRPDFEADQGPLGDEMRKRLEALGYVH